MILDFLKKTGKYIYGNKVLLIVCTLVVFTSIAHLLVFVGHLNENFENYIEHPPTQNEPMTKERFTNNNNNKLSEFVRKQIENANKNTNA